MKQRTIEHDFYTFSARVVRLTMEDGSTQMLITNLDPTEFPLPALHALYAKRWGIETSLESKMDKNFYSLCQQKNEYLQEQYKFNREHFYSEYEQEFSILEGFFYFCIELGNDLVAV